MQARRAAAFTLLEMMVVVLVIGVISSLVVGGFSNVIPAGREVAAVNKARVLNAARVTYALVAAEAELQWTAAASDAERCALLINAGVLTGAPGDWTSAAGGYTLALSGAIRARTVLRNSAGASLNYGE
jgi:prepilin-type N-terminal cleavage/methylation domain-containing protein